MSQSRIELFRHPLFNIGTAFTDAELRQRGELYVEDLKVMFPALQKLNEGYIERRHLVDRDQTILVVDLILLPQQRFIWTAVDGSHQSERQLLQNMRAKIYASGDDTQARIYRESCQAHFGDTDGLDARGTYHDKRLRHLMRKLSDSTMYLETPEGQRQLDFPRQPAFQISETADIVSGIVELVAPARIKLQALRLEGDQSCRTSRTFPRKGVWVHLPAQGKDLSREIEALNAAHTRTRVRLAVRAARYFGSSAIHHLILHVWG